MNVKSKAIHCCHEIKSIGHKICHAKSEVECTFEESIEPQWVDLTSLASIIGQSQGQPNLEAKFRVITLDVID